MTKTRKEFEGRLSFQTLNTNPLVKEYGDAILDFLNKNKDTAYTKKELHEAFSSVEKKIFDITLEELADRRYITSSGYGSEKHYIY